LIGLLILALFSTSILGGLLAYVLYKNNKVMDKIEDYTLEQEKKIALRGSNKPL